MVAAGGSWRPQWGHGGELGADGIPLKPQACIHFVRKAAQARLVRQGLFDRDRPLARLGEFWPDRSHGLAIGKFTRLHQARDQQGGERLSGGKDRRQGLGIEGHLPGPIRVAAIDID